MYKRQLKAYDPPPSALVGAPIDGVARPGKFLDVDVDRIHLVFHLARAGWLRFSDALPTTVIRPGKSPIALRVRLSDGSGFDLTEAGTKKSLAAYLVRDVQEVPGIARLGPDPLADGFSEADFAGLLAGRRTPTKGPLPEQARAPRGGGLGLMRPRHGGERRVRTGDRGRQGGGDSG